MTAALVDTSVLVALEAGRALDLAAIPEEVAVSVITSAELRAGVLVAGDTHSRTRRLSTLTRALQLDPIPIDEHVATAWADLRVTMRDAGRRLPVNDSWIAATAIAHDLILVTQDRDYVGLPGLKVVLV